MLIKNLNSNFLLFSLILFISASWKIILPLNDEPLAIFLTWQENPTTTMVIDWHTRQKQDQKLYYKEKNAGNWNESISKTHPFPFSDRFIHRVFLNNLKPGTSYNIKFGESGKEYYFKTMPANTSEEPVIIALGGDTMYSGITDLMKQTNYQVLKYDPDFVVIGGDLAYANGSPDNIESWYAWFDAWKNSLITEDNRIVPIIVALGNHEVARIPGLPNSGYYFHYENYVANDSSRESIAPFFYKLFAFPGQPGYNILDFGNYLSLVILDSDHTNPVEGEQTRWLSEQLQSRRNMHHIVPVYHVPAYSSVRNFEDEIPKRIRKFWLPLFEEHGVKVAFENHDHTYKLTYPIKNNKIDEEGIVFIGDGSWGRIPRAVRNKDAWYIKSADSVRCFVIMSIQGRHQSLLMINAEDGEVMDSYPSIPQLEGFKK
jgi:acid phosphatase type 7